MSKVEITIQLDPYTNEMKVMDQKPNSDLKMGVYIEDGKIFAMDDRLALEIIDSLGEECSSEIIGKSDYIIIYDSRNELQTATGRYLGGTCLIMKSDYGVKGMTAEELYEALECFKNRIVTINVGPYQASVYEIA